MHTTIYKIDNQQGPPVCTQPNYHGNTNDNNYKPDIDTHIYVKVQKAFRKINSK